MLSRLSNGRPNLSGRRPSLIVLLSPSGERVVLSSDLKDEATNEDGEGCLTSKESRSEDCLSLQRNVFAGGIAEDGGVVVRKESSFLLGFIRGFHAPAGSIKKAVLVHVFALFAKLCAAP